MLEAQKHQRTLIAAIAIFAAFLLLAIVFILLKMLRTRRQLKEADVVIGEMLAGHGETTDDADATCHAERSEASVPVPALTDREASILPLLAQGLTSKEIATKLFLTEQTIKWYRMRLLDKFKAKNTADLLTKGKEAGML